MSFDAFLPELCADRLQMEESNLSFSYKDKPLSESTTPSDIGLKKGDRIVITAAATTPPQDEEGEAHDSEDNGNNEDNNPK